MPESSQRPDETEILSDEDLRTLARRHEKLLRRFLREREREQMRREIEARTYSMAQRMAAEMLVRHADATGNRVPVAAPKQADTPSTETRKVKKSATVPEMLSPASPQKVEGAQHFDAPPEPSEAAKWWKKIGGFGLSFSLLFHAAIILVAIFWVVSAYVEPKDSPPEFFATGSGGGRGGERPSYADVQAARRKSVKIAAGTRSRKIVSKVAKSKFVLPELPNATMQFGYSGNSLAAGGAFALGGDLSSGSGGGLGGGVGVGQGIGIGNASNFVGKFRTTQKILGTDVTASRLAVYMDSSGSMTTVLPVVREEILKKFPTADVYEFMGCGMGEFPERKRSRLEQVSWNSKKKSLLRKYEREKKPSVMRRAARDLERAAKKNRAHGFSYDMGFGSGWKKKLSSYGNALLDEWSVSESSWIDLGHWLEMVFSEGGYDAVIVFADFQDYRDRQLGNESALFDRWLKLARKNGQRVYFFTTEMLPQNIFRALAEHTGGDVAIPKRVSKNSGAAMETEDFLEKVRRMHLPKGNVAQLSSPGDFEDVEEFDTEADDSDEFLSLE